MHIHGAFIVIKEHGLNFVYLLLPQSLLQPFKGKNEVGDLWTNKKIFY